jgi:hypothetical protein
LLFNGSRSGWRTLGFCRCPIIGRQRCLLLLIGAFSEDVLRRYVDPEGPQEFD